MKLQLKYFLLMAISFGILTSCSDDGGTSPTNDNKSATTIGTITKPAKNDQYFIGDTLFVEWSGDAQKAAISFIMGKGTETLNAITPVSTNGNSLKFIVPNFKHSNESRIQLVNNDNSADVVVSDSFTVNALMLTNPIGNETFSQGATVEITWRTSILIGGVTVWLSLDNGKNWDQLTVSGQVTPPDTSFTWVIGQENFTTVYPSTQCRIQINDYIDDAMKHKSTTFTIN